MAQAALERTGDAPRPKLTGRAFYESIGSPKYIVAPMVDRSEFAWRLLNRSYLDADRSRSLLAYTPMFHARLFREGANFRDDHFQPTRGSLVSKEKSSSPAWLDGNPALDRPLVVQFCANKPEDLLEAAQYVAPYCDAVDLNLGCPQDIARRGRYGSFLQEDWDTIHNMIRTLHSDLSIPVTAKMRILDTNEQTLEYAKMILSAGASILTVHGRRREQKGHRSGLADWSVIRYLRDNLPPDTVLFANGNILNSGDLDACLAATGADGVMSAEGNLFNPTIFATPPKEYNPREYWYGRDGKEGYRIDGVFRRYLDIIHRYVLDQEPPQRPPLYLPGDEAVTQPPLAQSLDPLPLQETFKERQSRRPKSNPNLRSVHGHLFQLLRPVLYRHTEIRDALTQAKSGRIESFERILLMVEDVICAGLDHESRSNDTDIPRLPQDMTPKEQTAEKYKRPWWVCQPYIRPLPDEAFQKGAFQLSRKEKEQARLRTTEIQPEEAPRPTKPLLGDIPAGMAGSDARQRPLVYR